MNSVSSKKRKKIFSRNLKSLLGLNGPHSISAISELAEKFKVDERRLRRWTTEGASRLNKQSQEELDFLCRQIGVHTADLWKSETLVGRVGVGFEEEYAGKISRIMRDFGKEDTLLLRQLIDEMYSLTVKHRIDQEIQNIDHRKRESIKYLMYWRQKVKELKARLSHVNRDLDRLDKDLKWISSLNNEIDERED